MKKKPQTITICLFLNSGKSGDIIAANFPRVKKLSFRTNGSPLFGRDGQKAASPINLPEDLGNLCFFLFSTSILVSDDSVYLQATWSKSLKKNQLTKTQNEAIGKYFGKVYKSMNGYKDSSGISLIFSGVMTLVECETRLASIKNIRMPTEGNFCCPKKMPSALNESWERYRNFSGPPGDVINLPTSF